MNSNPSCNDIIDVQNRTYNRISREIDITEDWKWTPYRRLAMAIASLISFGLGNEPGTAAAALGTYFLKLRKTRRPDLLAGWTEPTEEIMAVLKSVIDLIVGDPYRRAELDARLFARVACMSNSYDLRSIADRMGLDEKVVTAYDFSAMDLGCRSGHGNRIFKAGMGWKSGTLLPSAAVPTLWRIVGFELGIEELDVIMQAVPRAILERDGMDAYLMPDVALVADVKEWIASFRMPLKWKNHFRLTWRSLDGAPLVTDSPALDQIRTSLNIVA